MSEFDGVAPLGEYRTPGRRPAYGGHVSSMAEMERHRAETEEADRSKNEARKEARKERFRDYAKWMPGKLTGDCSQCGRRRKVGFAGRCFRCGG